MCRDRRKLSEDDLDLYSLGEGHPDLSISELRGIDQELSASLSAIFVTPLPEIVSNDLRKAVFYYIFMRIFVCQCCFGGTFLHLIGTLFYI